jgi:predicted PolB exonuclease-like 3'-5' exonuclease
MMEGRDDDPRVIVCRDEHEERYALGEFWRDVVMDGGAHRRLISFAGLRFDLPYLMRRSLYLNLDAPRLNIDKYRSNHIDLQAVLSYNGILKWHSLMFYAKRFGLAIPEGANEVDGSMIQGLVNDGSWEAVRAHCEADVRLTYDLAARLRYVDMDEDGERDIAEAEAVGF